MAIKDIPEEDIFIKVPMRMTIHHKILDGTRFESVIAQMDPYRGKGRFVAVKGE
jgi:hypothetical protein